MIVRRRRDCWGGNTDEVASMASLNRFQGRHIAVLYERNAFPTLHSSVEVRVKNTRYLKASSKIVKSNSWKVRAKVRGIKSWIKH